MEGMNDQKYSNLGSGERLEILKVRWTHERLEIPKVRWKDEQLETLKVRRK